MDASLAALVVPDFAARVVAWQRHQGRHGLPWQGGRDAYRIWLSEIMLQQTQVTTVLRYYEAFIRRFPTVADLAAAPLDDVLAAWSGLGYYSRARNLHRCAQAVVQHHAGRFPTAASVLVDLPGIGRSTAAAVAAFSSGERVAILDGNVKRVLTRHRGFSEDVSRPVALRRLWDLADALLPEQGIESYTQGLMDLGATLCTTRRPQCEQCPLQGDCVAHAQQRPQDYPVKQRRTSRHRRSGVLGLWRVLDPSGLTPGWVWLQRRPEAGVWAGLWSLPLWSDEASHEHALGEADGALALSVIERAALPTIDHALTHFDWALQPMRLVFNQRVEPPNGSVDGTWLPVNEALSRGLPAPVRRLLEDEAGSRHAQDMGAGERAGKRDG